MAKVVAGMTVSLDGFVNDRKGDASRLYPDLEALRKTELLRRSIRETGSVLMGRGAYDMGRGDFTGYEYQVPIFVVTHRPPEEEPRGQNERLRIHFVTDGVGSAVARAKAAAGGKAVTVVGGVNVIRQLLRANQVDEFHLGIVPVFLDGGLRLFEDLDELNLKLEQTEVLESHERTDIVYRVVR